MVDHPQPDWLSGLTYRDFLFDGYRCSEAIWGRLDWSRAYVDMGPSVAGNLGPYWHVPLPDENYPDDPDFRNRASTLSCRAGKLRHFRVGCSDRGPIRIPVSAGGGRRLRGACCENADATISGEMVMTRRAGLILAAILAAVIVGLLYLRMHIGLPEGCSGGM